MIKIISFDLQGTLSDASFSDEFWLETLPQLYAISHNITLIESKQILKEKFRAWGKYDYRYYSTNYWVSELKQGSFSNVQKNMINKPVFFSDSIELLNTLIGKELIIISSTTRDFIDVELGEYKRFFSKVYSSIDDFGIFGKPAELYIQIAKELKVQPNEIMHVGDCKEMDIINATKAGLHTFFFDNNRSRADLIAELKKVLKN
ncbi:MAG: HAD family hydrolase [Candidatus Woesearchaeota archaeon]